jgi:hypothetical protein
MRPKGVQSEQMSLLSKNRDFGVFVRNEKGPRDYRHEADYF